MVNEIKKVSKTVEKLLRDIPKTRESDKLLILKVWAEQDPSLNIEKFSYMDFVKLFLSGKLSPPESIRRTRQELQRLNPELEGKNRSLRQEKSVDMKYYIVSCNESGEL